MGVIVVMVSAGRQWQEDAANPMESNSLAGEKLKHSGIVRHAHGTGHDLNSEMEIAEAPGNARRLFHVRDWNLQHFFRSLFQYILCFALGVKVIAVRQRLFEIEAEVSSIFRHATPAALGQGYSISQQADVGMVMMPSRMMQVMADDDGRRHVRIQKG